MRPGQPDPPGLIADLTALGGAGAVVVELPGGREPPRSGEVAIGVCRAGALPTQGLDAFDILICADPAAPRPWIGLPPGRLEAALDALLREVKAQPVAAGVAAQVLRASLQRAFEDALAMESLAYSMLLASDGFRRWRAATPVRQRDDLDAPRVLVNASDGAIHIQLNRPGKRNAVDAAMRDALCEALTFAVEHPDRPPVELSGAGPAFSAGGDLDEFGSATDVGQAHLIRTLRPPAQLLYGLRDRATARLHGACVGAGIEVPAAAGRVIARPDAFFRLPEVSMGLIPGAGGTASLPRRIGRHRAAYLAISGADIDVETALAWGLIDAVEP
ncbi:MAG TPA: enoyl-CoA hydratase/isomerase family protein [Caulobacteraceae bacterium]|nr:enoyl-CoA hydratase/isomerase family protein [Caulobacteraceae bacterium]